MPRQYNTDDAVPVPAKKAPQKKKKNKPAHNRSRIKIDFNDREVSGYYMAASRSCKRAAVITFILLTAFLAFYLLFFRSSITYSNLMFLLRDFDMGANVSASDFADVSYPAETSVSFGTFKGRLAAAGSTGFRLYGSDGGTELSREAAMQSPRLVTGKKYALTYDAGALTYNIYTSVACVLKGESEQIIEAAAVSDSGSYALLTRSGEAKYAVTVYSSSFRPGTRYYKDKYVVDIALDSDGENLAIVSADAESSRINAEIMLCRPGSDKTETLTLENAMPLAVRYTESGNLVVLCDSKAAVISGGKILREYAFSDASPTLFAFSESAFAVLCSENAAGTDNTVFLFDSEGNLIYNNRISERVRKLACEGDRAVYLLGDDKVLRLEREGQILQTEAKENILDILPLYGKLLCCGETGAFAAEFAAKQ